MKRSTSESLSKKTFIYAIGSFGSKILSFLLVPLYSFYLNKDEFGYFDLVTTAISLIVPFATLQISDSVFRWLLTSEGREEVIKKNVSNGFFFIILNVGLVSFLSFIIFLIHPLKGHLVITAICINSMIYPFFQQIARGLGRNKLFAFNGLLYTLIFLLFNIIFLLIFKLSIDALFYSTFLAYFICSFFLFFQLELKKYIEWNAFDYKHLKDLVLYSIPLIPNTISWWLISSVNKYLILLFIGVSANGLFAMANRFPAILVVVNQVFTLAWQESSILSLTEADKKKHYSAVLNNLIKVQFSLVILLSLSSRFIVEKLISSEFHESWYFMPVLYLGIAFLSLAGFYGALYLGVMKTKSLFTTTIFGSLVNVVLGYLLIDNFGLMGIALATTIGYVVLFVIRIFSTKAIITFDFPFITFFKYFVLVIISFFTVYLSSVLVSLTAAVFFSLIILFDNRMSLINIIKRFVKI